MINILICANEKYLKIAMTTLYSIRCHTSEPIHCYLCQKGIAQKKLIKIVRQLNHYQIDCTPIDFDSVIDVQTWKLNGYTIEMYYRLFAQFFLPDSLDRVLYLDADIVALNDISEFYFQDLDGKALVACQDYLDVIQNLKIKKESLGIPQSSTYFNSGVLLLNLEWLRVNTSVQDTVQLIDELKEKLTFPDQDVLNVLYHDKIKYAPYQKYNMHGMNLPKLQRNCDTVLLHYAGGFKPWSVRCSADPNAHFYWDYLVKQYPSSIFRFFVVRVLGGSLYKLYRLIKYSIFKKK